MSYVHYQNIQSSLLRFCADFAEANPGLGTVNLDAHTDEAQWPEGDFIGLGELNVDVAETYAGQCMFGLSTLNDTNLFRMGQLMQKLSGFLLPNKNIPVYNAQTGMEIGKLFVLQGTRIGAPLPTKTQPIQPIAIRFESDLRSF
ncbi:hypothetical protein MHM88_14375 [Epibacterium sp. MM17-32]|uniref:hypothetical protein n=1 Tax=Epibacterium sp. MM17-32 TaxID=2917734 RepID=UPI001EF68F7C|nr:hypothetical protein [Epibacterium sp. MM17-32]MCG7628994.1 hypothetical protein [Epibacterium sp. MM17-32]